MTGPCQRPAVLLVLGLYFTFVGLVQTKADDRTSKPPATESSSQYAGAETCGTCHEDLFKGVQKTRHWNSVLRLKGGAEAHSCETCHGPGAEHANSGGEKAKIFTFKGAMARTISDRCLTCHDRKEETGHFAQSAHAGAGVSCITC